tara:strand:+ start:30 stop:755 length:726 start_codon:yes stop_codon:yes gene_type:complete
MATHNGSLPIVTKDLVYCLDGQDKLSYPGSGTTWTDLTGNGHDMTFVNGPSATADGKAVNFSRADSEYGQLDDATAFSNANGGTLTGVCKYGTDHPTSIFNTGWYSQRNNDNTGLGLAIHRPTNTTQIRAQCNDDGNSHPNLFSGNLGTDDKWSFAYTYNPSGELKLYVNGAVVASRAASSGALTFNNPDCKIAIGVMGSGNGIQAGFNTDISIYSLCYYNRPLTNEEVQQNYQSQKRFGL